VPIDLHDLALSLVPSLGGQTLERLFVHFGDDTSVILNASIQDLCEVKGIGKKIATAIQSIDLEMFEHRFEQWQSHEIKILEQSDFPQSIQAIPDAPRYLFLRGELSMLYDEPYVAIVGTRNPTQNALNLTQSITKAGIQYGYQVISGMALGIDGQAQTTALKQNSTTLAVLGNGILNPYPNEHRELASRIIEQGALICECAPDAPVTPARLVARNRLITALASVVIVVETSEKGGAMHAANFAFQQDKLIFTPNIGDARGNQTLIHSGMARAVESWKGYSEIFDAN